MMAIPFRCSPPVGRHPELIGQVLQHPRQPCLLAGYLGDFLGAGQGQDGGFADRFHAACQFPCNGYLFFGGGGNLAGHIGNAVHIGQDIREGLLQLGCLLAGGIRQFVAFHNRAAGVVSYALEAIDNVFDLGGGLVGLLRQGPNFVGNHRKSSAVLARAGGFNGCVQGQQVGLVGNLPDHVHHIGDG